MSLCAPDVWNHQAHEDATLKMKRAPARSPSLALTRKCLLRVSNSSRVMVAMGHKKKACKASGGYSSPSRGDALSTVRPFSFGYVRCRGACCWSMKKSCCNPRTTEHWALRRKNWSVQNGVRKSTQEPVCPANSLSSGYELRDFRRC